MDDDCAPWPLSPADASLDSDSVHVWSISLKVPAHTLNRLGNSLVPAEGKRAKAFHFDRDRNRFIVGRATLRKVLGTYLHARPASICLEYSPFGKPQLAGEFALTGLQFNLAHCEDVALLAVARGRVVGVDVERVRPMEDALEMASSFCSAREYAEFKSLPIEKREGAFFRIWTRKEAWLKATGQGIGQALEQVEVSFSEGQNARFNHLPEEAGTPAAGWNLRELTPVPGFIGALAMPGEPPRVSCWACSQEEEFEYA